MPEEAKAPELVSSSPEGAEKPTPKTPAAEPAAPAIKPETIEAALSAKPPDTAAAPAPAPNAAEAKPAAPAPAKPAAPATAKPAAPAKPAGPQPEPWNSDLVAELKKQYGSGIREANIYLGQKYLLVDSGIVFEILSRMLEGEQYDYCVDITAVHWPKRELQFDIIYILYSFPHNERVRIKAQIAEGQHVHSAVNLWPTTNWLEREVFDMFGIVFDGHPDLKRILLPDGWKGHPLRKDYDILLQDKEWVQNNLGIESGQ
jgi:NADH-quinone oxidoreductase subunit C